MAVDRVVRGNGQFPADHMVLGPFVARDEDVAHFVGASFMNVNNKIHFVIQIVGHPVDPAVEIGISQRRVAVLNGLGGGVFRKTAEGVALLEVEDLFQKIDGEIFRIYLRYGAPVLCNEMLWSIGSTMLSVIMGHMGSNFVAANSICQVVFQCTSVINQGVGQAAGVMAGNTIGGGKNKRARNQLLTLFVVRISFCLLVSPVMFEICGTGIDFYKVTEETRVIAHSIMDMMCILVVFQAISSINMFGTLRGGGDSKYVLFFDVTSMWFFSVPLGWLAGLVFDWPVWLVYLCLRSGDIFKSVGCIFRILSGKWIKDVTRSDEEKKAAQAEEAEQV